MSSSNGRGDGDDDGDLAANALIIFASNSRFHIILHTAHTYAGIGAVLPLRMCVFAKELSRFFFCNLQIIIINL